MKNTTLVSQPIIKVVPLPHQGSWKLQTHTRKVNRRISWCDVWVWSGNIHQNDVFKTEHQDCFIRYVKRRLKEQERNSNSQKIVDLFAKGNVNWFNATVSSATFHSSVLTVSVSVRAGIGLGIYVERGSEMSYQKITQKMGGWKWKQVILQCIYT